MGWQHRGKEKITKDFWEHIASFPVERGIMASRKSVPFIEEKSMVSTLSRHPLLHP
jgi:hypothetical protein